MKWIAFVSNGKVIVEASDVEEARKKAAIKVDKSYEFKPWTWRDIKVRIASPSEIKEYAKQADFAKSSRDMLKAARRPRRKTIDKLVS